jgi:hypothetical protein
MNFISKPDVTRPMTSQVCLAGHRGRAIKVYKKNQVRTYPDLMQ